MNKIKGRKATNLTANHATKPPKHLIGKSTRVTVSKRLVPPLTKKYSGDPPLRAARGDDDLMSEEPWVNERG